MNEQHLESFTTTMNKQNNKHDERTIRKHGIKSRPSLQRIKNLIPYKSIGRLLMQHQCSSTVTIKSNKTL